MSVSFPGSFNIGVSRVAIFAGGCATATLVVAQVFARLKLMRGFRSTLGLQKFEWIIGSGLIYLTAFFTRVQSPMGLGAIAVVTVRRLCSDFTMISVIRRPTIEELFNEQADTCHAVVEIFVGFVGWGFPFLFFSGRNPQTAQVVVHLASIVCCLEMKYLRIEERFFNRWVVDRGFFGKDDTSATVILKTERVQSLFMSLRSLAHGLVLYGFVGSMLNLQANTLDIFGSTLLQRLYRLCCLIEVIVSSIFVLARSLWYTEARINTIALIVKFKSALPLCPSTEAAHLQFLKFAYSIGIKIPFLDERQEKIYRSARQEISPGEINSIRWAFNLCSELLPLAELKKIIRRFPLSLTADFLGWGPKFWKEFSEADVKEFLLLPQLKTLLKADLEHMKKTVADLALQVDQVNDEGECQEIFHRVKPLYEQLEEFNFQPALKVIELLLKKFKAGEFLTSIRNLKAAIEPLNAQALDLQGKLEGLVEDLFTVALESLGLREGDISGLFEGSEGSPFHQLSKALQKKEVRWKGDLIHEGILGRDNSTEAVKKRLQAFFAKN